MFCLCIAHWILFCTPLPFWCLFLQASTISCVTVPHTQPPHICEFGFLISFKTPAWFWTIYDRLYRISYVKLSQVILPFYFRFLLFKFGTPQYVCWFGNQAILLTYLMCAQRIPYFQFEWFIGAASYLKRIVFLCLLFSYLQRFSISSRGKVRERKRERDVVYPNYAVVCATFRDSLFIHMIFYHFVQVGFFLFSLVRCFEKCATNCIVGVRLVSEIDLSQTHYGNRK